MSLHRKALRIAAPLSLCVVIAACETVPLTGRSQFNLVSQSELAQLSTDAYQQVLTESTLSSDTEMVDNVRQIGWRIADATERYLQASGYPTQRFDWEFNLIESEEVNAWAMPGGKVAVYTGILPIAQDDAGLAAIMAHEVAHVVARHGSERMTQSLLVEMGGQALGAALNSNPSRTVALFNAAYGAGAQYGILLPYSRLHENEADRIGLTLMALAGYDPRAMVGVWERMAEQGGPRPPQFLSTHPDPRARIRNIEEHLPEALAVYQRGS